MKWGIQWTSWLESYHQPWPGTSWDILLANQVWPALARCWCSSHHLNGGPEHGRFTIQFMAFYDIYIYNYTYIYIIIHIYISLYIYICVYCHFIGKLTKPVDLIGFTAPYWVRHDFSRLDRCMPLGYVFYRQFSGLPVEATAWDMGCICQRQHATHCYPEYTAYLC